MWISIPHWSWCPINCYPRAGKFWGSNSTYLMKGIQRCIYQFKVIFWSPSRQTFPGFSLIFLNSSILAISIPSMSSNPVSRSTQPSLDSFIAQITAHRMMSSCGINVVQSSVLSANVILTGIVIGSTGLDGIVLCYRGNFVWKYGLDLQTMRNEGRKRGQ